MDHRPLVCPRLLVSRVLALALAGIAHGQTQPVDRLPYKITAHLAIAPEARIDARGRELLLASWRTLVSRLVGPPWDLTIAEGERAAAGRDLDALEPEQLAPLATGFDKLWLIQLGREGPAISLAGCELDTATMRLGPAYRRAARSAADLPRALLDLAQELFRPSATISGQSGGGADLLVRGSSLPASSPFGQVVAAGSVFRPIRFVTFPDGAQKVLDIPYTYLRVESVDGALAHCAIHSALRDPLTRRISQKSILAALGSKPGPYPTRLRFLSAGDKTPAAGFLLTGRPLPDGAARELGMTDREGRIVLEPSPSGSDELLALRLLAGSVEPVVEFPLMPGESAQERTVSSFDPRNLTVVLEARLEALRDSVIDLVAIRARLEARLKARLEGDDFPGADAALKEFYQLPGRDTFAAQLARLKEEAAAQQAKTRTAVLTKTAQAQIAELDNLIVRYLDDEAFRAYADALTRARTEAQTKAPGAAKKVGGPR